MPRELRQLLQPPMRPAYLGSLRAAQAAAKLRHHVTGERQRVQRARWRDPYTWCVSTTAAPAPSSVVVAPCS